MKKKYAVGIDVGGTTAKFGIVDRAGSILEQDRVPTNEHEVVEDFIDDIKKPGLEVPLPAKQH